MAAQAITFFSAGSDTTSPTLTYTLYELAINHLIQNRLRKEILGVLEQDGDLSYEALQEMKYLEIVVNETLRKYPLTSFLNRKSATMYKIDDGFTLDKDMSVMIPIAGSHFDPEYFPNPEQFDPDRFSDENKHKIVPYTFLPFGKKPRNCIGQRFAMLVAKVALAYLIKNFCFVITPKTPVPLDYAPSLFIINKSGINLKVLKV